MKSLSILLVGNGTNANRGCEAIARGTAAMFAASAGRMIEMRSGVVVSNDVEAEAVRCHVSRPGEPAQFPISLAPSRMITDRIRARLPGGRVRYDSKGLDEFVGGYDVVLEVGGDNYTLDYGPPWAFVDMDLRLLKRGLPVFIWGASVGPFTAMPNVAAAMVRHFKRLRCVLVRESESYNGLVASGVTNVQQMADPAIFMELEEPADPGIDVEAFRGAIGLNLSPFQAVQLSRCSNSYWATTQHQLDALAAFGAELVRRILAAHRRPVVLVPHVFGPATWNDDHQLLTAVRGRLSDNEKRRVAVPPATMTAPNLKWLMSHCCVFAGSRTHSTLGAASSGVPTLAFGYSRKAKGLMFDLYKSDDMCIPSSAFGLATVLAGIARLIEGEDMLRARLAAQLRVWQERGRAAVQQIVKSTAIA